MVDPKRQSSGLIFYPEPIGARVASGLRGNHLGYLGLLIDSYLGHGICQSINRH